MTVPHAPAIAAGSDAAPAQWGVVALLSGAMAFSLVDRFALSLLFEPIKTDLGLSDTQLGLLHGVAFGLFYAALGIPIARLVDTWSRKWVIFWGIAVWSVANALCGLARSFGHLLLARIGVAAGEAALAPAGYSMIADVVPRARLATAISVFQMGSLIGAGLAFLAGGWLYGVLSEWSQPQWLAAAELEAWHLTFIALSLPGIPLLILVGLLREPARRDAAARQDATARPVAATGVFRYLWEQRAIYGALYCGSACLVAVSYALVSWAPSVLAREFGWPIGEVGVRMGLLMLTAAPAGVLAGGVLADRWSRTTGYVGFGSVLTLAATATLPLALAIGFADTGLHLFVLLAVLQFTTGLAVGVGPAALQPLTPAALRGRVSAVYVFAVNIIGLGLGPVAIGALSDHGFAGESRLQNSLAAYCAVASVVALVLLAWFRRMAARR